MSQYLKFLRYSLKNHLNEVILTDATIYVLLNKRAKIALSHSSQFKSSNPKPSAAQLFGTPGANI